LHGAGSFVYHDAAKVAADHVPGHGEMRDHFVVDGVQGYSQHPYENMVCRVYGWHGLSVRDGGGKVILEALVGGLDDGGLTGSHVVAEKSRAGSSNNHAIRGQMPKYPYEAWSDLDIRSFPYFATDSAQLGNRLRLCMAYGTPP
jgi:hypothetical protein